MFITQRSLVDPFQKSSIHGHDSHTATCCSKQLQNHDIAIQQKGVARLLHLLGRFAVQESHGAGYGEPIIDSIPIPDSMKHRLMNSSPLQNETWADEPISDGPIGECQAPSPIH
jgi:hypothetical protein